MAAISANGALPAQLGPSLRRIVIGLGLAIAIGMPLGLLMGVNRLAYRLLEPITELIRPIPSAAYIPVAILFLGLGDQMKIFVIILACVFPILLNTYGGVKGIDPVLIDTGRTLGTPRLSILRKIVFPAALPSVLTGIRISLGIALIVSVRSEMIAGNNGLGYFIFDKQRTFHVSEVFAGNPDAGRAGLRAEPDLPPDRAIPAALARHDGRRVTDRAEHPALTAQTKRPHLSMELAEMVRLATIPADQLLAETRRRCCSSTCRTASSSERAASPARPRASCRRSARLLTFARSPCSAFLRDRRARAGRQRCGAVDAAARRYGRRRDRARARNRRFRRGRPRFPARDRATAGEIHLTKLRFSAFFETALEVLLRGAGIETVVIGGVASYGCIIATYIDACSRGFFPLLCAEAVDGGDPTMHQAAMDFMGASCVGVDEIMRIWSHAALPLDLKRRRADEQHEQARTRRVHADRQ